jgi:hypothetical protein
MLFVLSAYGVLPVVRVDVMRFLPSHISPWSLYARSANINYAQFRFVLIYFAEH